jgi:hypothetical protein
VLCFTVYLYIEAVWCSCLVLAAEIWFNPWPFRGKLGMLNVALQQIFLPELRGFPISIIAPVFPIQISFMYHGCYVI